MQELVLRAMNNIGSTRHRARKICLIAMSSCCYDGVVLGMLAKVVMLWANASAVRGP